MQIISYQLSKVIPNELLTYYLLLITFKKQGNSSSGNRKERKKGRGFEKVSFIRRGRCAARGVALAETKNDNGIAEFLGMTSF
ncbi:MAG: hypothetical protein F6K31_21090 [Symploca sp. SIO2G7]|nr:hypothetical protein [Symploca sp. SIO2G7]